MTTNQAPDVIGQLRRTVDTRPTDYLLWTKLLDQVLIADQEDQIRATFDKYLGIFKFDVRVFFPSPPPLCPCSLAFSRICPSRNPLPQSRYFLNVIWMTPY